MRMQDEVLDANAVLEAFEKLSGGVCSQFDKTAGSVIAEPGERRASSAKIDSMRVEESDFCFCLEGSRASAINQGNEASLQGTSIELPKTIRGAEGAPLLVPTSNDEKDSSGLSTAPSLLCSKTSDKDLSILCTLSQHSSLQQIKGVGIDYTTKARALPVIEHSTTIELQHMFRHSELDDSKLSKSKTDYLLMVFALKEAAFKAVGGAFARAEKREEILHRAGFIDFEISGVVTKDPVIKPQGSMLNVVDALGIKGFYGIASVFEGFCAALCVVK